MAIAVRLADDPHLGLDTDLPHQLGASRDLDHLEVALERRPVGPERHELGEVAVMEQGRVIDLDRAIALEAARLSIQHTIAMADSVMLATSTASCDQCRHLFAIFASDRD